MSKTVQLSVGDFHIAIIFYATNIMMIIQNSIPGVGAILYSEREGNSIDVDQLLGDRNDMLILLAKKIAEQFSVPAITFVMAFRPALIATFDSVRQFLTAFTEVASSAPHE
jgi:hypothetical protein